MAEACIVETLNAKKTQAMHAVLIHKVIVINKLSHHNLAQQAIIITP